MVAERQRAVALRQRVHALNEQRLARASRIAVPPLTSSDLPPTEGWALWTIALVLGGSRVHCSGAWALSPMSCCAAHDQQRPAPVWKVCCSAGLCAVFMVAEVVICRERQCLLAKRMVASCIVTWPELDCSPLLSICT